VQEKWLPFFTLASMSCRNWTRLGSSAVYGKGAVPFQEYEICIPGGNHSEQR
jgi:hypothetical protein